MKRLLFPVVMSVLMSACMVEPDQGDLVKYMVVETTYDTLAPASVGNVNVFKTFSTFVLRKDTIGFVSSVAEDTILVDGVNVQGEFVTPVVEKVAENVIAAGYTRVLDTQNPDFAVKLVILQNFSFTQFISYPGYYSGYYGYYGGYYGPSVSTYYSNFVTLVIEVVDIKHYGANNNRYKVIWSGYIGDLAATLDLTNSTIEAVDQAFEQSPYFSKN